MKRIFHCYLYKKLKGAGYSNQTRNNKGTKGKANCILNNSYLLQYRELYIYSCSFIQIDLRY